MEITQLSKIIGILHRRFQTMISHELDFPALSTTNANFLLFISEHDHITAKQLSNELAINKGLVSREMTRLETAGYITRQADATDPRITWITLTQTGQETAVAVRAIMTSIWQEVLATTPEADVLATYGHLAEWRRQADRLADQKRQTTEKD